MCRQVVFSGFCTRCGEWFQWDELSQALSCLEAKNNGEFGDCRRGVHSEQHSFNQECDACTEEQMADEGVGDLEDAPEEQEQAHKHHGAEQAPDRADPAAEADRTKIGELSRGERGRNKRQRTS